MRWRLRHTTRGPALRTHERVNDLSISNATFELFKMKTREFRRELLEIAKLDNEPSRVVQFTFNLFPISGDLRKKPGWEKEITISGEWATGRGD